MHYYCLSTLSLACLMLFVRHVPPRKSKKNEGFLIFSGDLGREQFPEVEQNSVT